MTSKPTSVECGNKYYFPFSVHSFSHNANRRLGNVVECMTRRRAVRQDDGWFLRYQRFSRAPFPVFAKLDLFTEGEINALTFFARKFVYTLFSQPEI